MITKIGQMSVGAALPSTAQATAAIDVLVAASLAEVSAKLEGYIALALPSPSFDISAQITGAVQAYTSATAEVSAIPGGATLVAALDAAVAAQTAAQLAIAAFAPGSSAKIDAALAAKAGLNVQVTAGVSGPNINVALITQIVAQLTALKASIEAKASLSASIGSNLAAAGINVYRFDGDVSVAGSELQGQINADALSGQSHFVVLIPTTSVGWQAIQATIKTS